jgi:lipoprotein NlpI
LAYSAKGKPDWAIEDYNESIALNRKDPTAFYNRGLAYSKTGKFNRAIEDFDEALSLKPNDAAALYGRGHALYRRGRHDAAIRDFSAALRLKPGTAAFFYGRGLAYGKKGRHEQAIADHDKVIRLKPDYMPAYLNRGRSKFFLARFREAVPDLERAARAVPKDLFRASWLYLARSRAGTDGRAALRDAVKGLDLRRWPGPLVLMYLGRMSGADVIESADQGSKRKRREKLTEAYYFVAQHHLIRGDGGEAKELLLSVLKLGVKHFVVYTGARAELARTAK